ncbi:MAG TPA: ribonuclease R, partial [Roseiarcus sp.]|nr:ribonuclease R [Roseiarcus sp.]
ARAFGVRGDAKSDLKVMLKELTSEGAIARGGKTFHRPGRLPTTLVAEVVAKNRDGDMIARPVEWSGAGAAPRIRLKRSRSKAETGRAPALGARVLLKIALDPDASPGAPAYGGRLVKIIERPKVRVLGVYRRLADGGGRVAPVEKRAREEFFVPAGFENGAREGDLVALETISESRFGPANARIVEKLGSLRSESAISLIAINAHQIPHIFPAAALAEAEAARPAGMRHREDWRRLPLVTIDPADAKDHDDAVYAAPDPDPANPGGFILTVAIADVAHYVRPGSALDKEALERGNSVYFPGRVVPMLPERISNDLCSLRPGEDRPALAVRMTIDRQGRKLRHKFHRIMMRSAAKLSYEQAQAAIDGAPDNDTTPIVETVIKPLYRAYEAIRIERSKRNPLDLDLPERKLILNADGSLARVIWPERLGAHRLIEEFMILANVAAAESLEEAKVSLIYRAHDAPSLEKLEDLNQFLATLGVKFARGERLRPAQFNGVLARVKGEPHEALVNEVVLRSQSQAEYAHENYGHFGLNLRRYAHFTSPIRRYADLVVHRALVRVLGLGEGGLQDMRGGELAQIAEHISAAERRAMAAERETVDRVIAAHLADRVGAVFVGRIGGVTRAGLFVKLSETGADGFVPAATLGADYFRFEEGRRALVGTRSGETFRLGDDVEVKL